jgi:WAS/WASL-interacting protein
VHITANPTQPAAQPHHRQRFAQPQPPARHKLTAGQPTPNRLSQPSNPPATATAQPRLFNHRAATMDPHHGPANVNRRPPTKLGYPTARPGHTTSRPRPRSQALPIVWEDPPDRSIHQIAPAGHSETHPGCSAQPAAEPTGRPRPVAQHPGRPVADRSPSPPTSPAQPTPSVPAGPAQPTAQHPRRPAHLPPTEGPTPPAADHRKA